jgi:hypothetical protein
MPVWSDTQLSEMITKMGKQIEINERRKCKNCPNCAKNAYMKDK